METKHTPNAVFIHAPELERYSYPDSSPFKTSRAGLTRKRLLGMGLLSGTGVREMAPRRASRAELEQFHTPRYLDALARSEQGELDHEAFAMGIGSGDCPVFRGMNDYAAWAAGASLTGARLIGNGEAAVTFNPSGGYHHAHAARAGGFCYINDIVLAALALAARFKRVLFLDLDVHHCDGVQAAFYRRRDVMTISLHETGKLLFPGTGFENEIGEGEGLGFSANVPLPPGTYDGAYQLAFEQVALPLMRAYDPGAIILELGMDTLAGDPLAHLQLTNNVYAAILKQIVALGKPILATGGGGYHVENTVRGWSLAWSVLSGNDVAEDLSAGLGGVMLANTEWVGGLRDRVLAPSSEQRASVDMALTATIRAVRAALSPYHAI